MRRAPVGLALLVLLAGCASPIAAPGAGQSDETATIRVENATLPIDPGRPFDWVTDRLESEAAPPRRIAVVPTERMAIMRDPVSPFFDLVGVDRPEGADRTATALGYVADPDVVHVNAILLSDPDQLRSTLVHEYVHVVQKRRGAPQTLRASVPAANTTDGRAVRLAVMEGVATAVETEHWRTHGGTGSSPVEAMGRSFRATEGARQWLYAPYYLGARYVESRPVALAAVEEYYADPPHTTEELLAGLPSGAEPLPPLAVTVATGDWQRNGTDRMGQLFVRVALATQLDAERASAAADGWGTDVRVAVTSDNRTAYVWALRFDDRTNATAFENATRAYLADRATKRGGVWIDDGAAFSLSRVGRETVILILGNRSFVTAADVSGSSASVRVDPTQKM
ncbi:MAG: hypothetical protein ABEJ77_02445 [Halanaeroarchaeum sp.]